MKNTSRSPLIWVALLVLTVWTGMSAAVAQQAGERRGYAAQREYLVTELGLDAAQQKKLDAYTFELLPRVLAFGGLSPEERTLARARITLEANQKLNAMLTPEQRATYALMQSRKSAGNTVGAPTATTPVASGAAGS